MLTTAGPYFCTMLLKSGSTAAGLPVAGTGVTGAAAGAGAGAASAGAPTAYKTVTGAATTAAPSTAAASGFRIRVLKFMANTPTNTGHRGPLQGAYSKRADLNDP